MILQRRQTIHTTKNPSECAQIISGSILKGDTNLLSKYEARAQPNQRLRPAFGIDNAFTTDHSERHKEYRNKVGTMLRPDWNMVASAAKRLAKNECPKNLVNLVQSFVLKMTINVLFRHDFPSLDDESISLVASEINDIWIGSKLPRHIVPWSKQDRLHDALRLLVPNRDPLDPQRNAMNFILPAFETMWRIVLRCFIEVRYRGAEETEEWIAALKLFLENPTVRLEDSHEGASEIEKAISIVREALRLYPPTRHIHRHFRFASGSSILAIADIEGLHRDTAIWGFDADCFRPSRWANMRHEPEPFNAWMPFGSSPFLCPAKPDFGPRMIGILVAALVDAFSDVRYELNVRDPRGQKESAKFYGLLRSDRDSYKELFLEKVDRRCR
ncbi:uncharacterized protein CC84DRAFT_1136526 [Paraphaeosphaeria sporulosa]|uniref:Cytochrome P450 n=1 Tax=Paraphaeosphaeria sporulosa TaxID=1460663 RepID=A0A177D2B2_9PLEO|nr:uncharacterized protein CC84DRAFT_1136526 [Paraphaeosphaeria sporulosa]OAG13159.1 hypothetical protein CC84DRAFT_1136526 [Paraphaeosphaeria sporulosa]